MNAQMSANRWAKFLVIMLIALPGIGLWTKFPSAVNLPARHPGLNSACNSETPVLLTPISPITHLTADPLSLYWLTRGNPGTVMKMSKLKGNPQVLTELAWEPHGILADNKSVFWVEETWQPNHSVTLKKVDKRGKKVTELWQTTGWIRNLSMDGHNFYWLDYEAVLRMPKNGGKPEVFVSGLEGFNNLAIVNRQIFIGGKEGLGILERPGQMPRILITSDQLIRDLHIGLRDERSIYFTGSVIGIYRDEIIFEFYVANNPGMISCTDNASYIVALPEVGGKPHLLLIVQGGLIDANLHAPYLYSVGNCRGGQMINLKTGKASTMKISSNTFALTVDKRYIYWTSIEGLKCMRRPR